MGKFTFIKRVLLPCFSCVVLLFVACAGPQQSASSASSAPPSSASHFTIPTPQNTMPPIEPPSSSSQFQQPETLTKETPIFPVYSAEPKNLPPKPSITPYTMWGGSLTEFCYEDQQGNEKKLLYPALNGLPTTPKCEFGSDAFFALLYEGESEYVLAVSDKDGKTWDILPTGIETNAYTTNMYISFSSRDSGCILFAQDKISWEDGEYQTATLFYTSNGGKSWEEKAPVDIPGYIYGFQLASPAVAWIGSGSYKDLQLFETYDGGNSWSKAYFQLEPQMITGTYGLMQADHVANPYTPNWKDGKWKIDIGLTRSTGYAWVQLSFVPSPDGSVWVWNAPNWKMPNGIHPFSLIEALDDFTIPLEYDAAVGLPENELFYHIQAAYVRDYLIRVGKLKLETNVDFIDSPCILPAAEINKLMRILYGNANFDIANADDYDKESGGVQFHWYCEHGSFMDIKEYHSVTALPSGDIEIVFAIKTYANDGGVPLSEIPFRYQRCIFRPVITEDGVQLFSLLKAEEIDKLN